MLYSFNLNNRAFKAIKEGRKKFEIRVTTIDDIFDYSVVMSGDYIKFRSFDGEVLFTQVLYVNWYKSIEELLLTEGTEYTLSSTNDFDEGVKSINSFNGYTDGMKKNGVYCIRVDVVCDIDSNVNLSDLELGNIDLDKYVTFVGNIKSDMNNPDWLGDFEKKDLEFLLGNGSNMWMYYHKGNFVCSMISIPASEREIKKFELSYDYRDVIDYGPMVVSSKYRGNNFQYKMLLEQDEFARNNGYKYAVATVHPDNIFSINNLIKDNFVFVKQKNFTRGLRNIYVKEL